MLIQRITTFFNPGATQQGIALLKDELSNFSNYEITPNAIRIYKLQNTTGDTVVGDWEFDNLPHADAFWTYWLALPTAEAFSLKFHALQAKDQESMFLDTVANWSKHV